MAEPAAYPETLIGVRRDFDRPGGRHVWLAERERSGPNSALARCHHLSIPAYLLPSGLRPVTGRAPHLDVLADSLSLPLFPGCPSREPHYRLPTHVTLRLSLIALKRSRPLYTVGRGGFATARTHCCSGRPQVWRKAETAFQLQCWAFTNLGSCDEPVVPRSVTLEYLRLSGGPESRETAGVSQGASRSQAIFNG